jgi:L-threonylcarbamoyladenylate synthase
LTIIKHNISYRIPNHQKLLELISKVDFVYSSSANISGNNPILHTQDAINIFKKHNFDIVIVDGHQLGERPSTIIDLDRIKVLRIGTINPEPIIKQLKDIKSSSNI